jgi:hypothetical protein
MQRHEIPTHLEVEDKILGTLTVRQLLFLAVGLSLSYGLWGLLHQLAASPDRHLPLVAQLALAALPALCTLVLALVQPGGRPLEEWLLAIMRYAGQPKVCVWRPLPDEEGDEGDDDVPEQLVGASRPLRTAGGDMPRMPVTHNAWARIGSSEEREGDPA